MYPTAISKLAATGNYEKGRQQPISRITFHHIVGDAPAAISRFQTPGVQVSASYVIGSDGTIYCCVNEADTPYSDGNYSSNLKTISIEHAGGVPEVPYTDAMYSASIRLCAYLIKKYNINDFQRHRDVIDKTQYPGGTLCPGDLDVERIVNQAKEGGEMFNEGDRVNLNVYWFGKDKGLGKAQVGKDWKSAMYELFSPGSEFDFEFKVNDGDVANINAVLKTDVATVAKAVKSQNWKDAYYGYFSHLISSDFVPVDEQLFKKKAQ